VAFISMMLSTILAWFNRCQAATAVGVFPQRRPRVRIVRA
jgi:hypothetical protein